MGQPASPARKQTTRKHMDATPERWKRSEFSHASTGLGMKEVEEQSAQGGEKPQRWKKNPVKHRTFEGKEEDRWNCPFCDYIGEAETQEKRQKDRRDHIYNRHPGVLEGLRATLHRRSWRDRKVTKNPRLNRHKGRAKVLRVLAGNREPLPLREPGAITDTGMAPSCARMPASHGEWKASTAWPPAP